jgi:hypothetical protein
MRRVIAAIIIVVGLATVASGQSCDPEKDKQCTVQGALNFYRGEVLVEDVAGPIAREVVNTNRPTTAPDGFAGRLHNSYQDFLNLLSVAVSDVKEADDGQALIVRFNPFRKGRHLVGVTLTLAQPKVGDVVTNAIPEDVREATVTLLEKQLGDTDDQTLSASYSYASRHCGTDRDAESMCWGRNPDTYRDLIGAMLPEPSPSVTDVTNASIVLASHFDQQEDVMGLLVKDARNEQLAIGAIKALAEAEKASLLPAIALEKALFLNLLPTLIDNQPQITGSASWRSPGRLGGADSRSYSLEFHSGRENLNTLRAECRQAADMGPCMISRLQALGKRGLSTDKYVGTITYKSNEAYSLTDLRLDPPVPGFESADSGSSTEFNVKLQAGTQIGTEIMGEPMRADLSFEGIRTDKSEIRTANRWVGKFTVSVPIGEKMTLPFTVTYANKSEFLGEEADRVGTHFGISYRLPALFGGQK